MKYVMVTFYTVLVVFSGTWMVSSLVGNRLLGLSWRPDELAFTFILMTLFSISALFLQLHRPLCWWLLLQSILVGVPLVVAAMYHMFPAKSTIPATVHLILAGVFIVLNIVTYLRAR